MAMQFENVLSVNLKNFRPDEAARIEHLCRSWGWKKLHSMQAAIRMIKRAIKNTKNNLP